MLSALLPRRRASTASNKNGIRTGDVICRMVVRDVIGDTLGNSSAIYPHVYMPRLRS